ncbi:hypothetical protein HBB16_10840 [Pseudonocardia sp. MCCB 268]|nr:hypothetical protein [Pseudonocardia cytotoxica]
MPLTVATRRAYSSSATPCTRRPGCAGTGEAAPAPDPRAHAERVGRRRSDVLRHGRPVGPDQPGGQSNQDIRWIYFTEALIVPIRPHRTTSSRRAGGWRCAMYRLDDRPAAG